MTGTVFKLVIKPIVFLDVEEAIVFYHGKSIKISEQFYKNFLQSIQDIQSFPFNYSFASQPVRRHVIKTFLIKFIILLQVKQ